MTKQTWEMTPTQYRNWRLAEIRREYGCTKAEAADCIFANEYLTMLEYAAQEGHRIPNVVLDRMTERQRYCIIKTATSYGFDHLYHGYIHPSIR